MILSSGGAALPALPALLALLALLLYTASALPGQGRWHGPALLFGWVCHGAALVLDIGGFGAVTPGIRFGFAPVLSLTVWTVIGVHAAESRLLPLPGVRRMLSLAGAATLLVVLLFPGEMRVHAGSALAPLHWLLGIASYGLFGVAVLHALLLDDADRRLRDRRSAGGPATGPFGLPLLRLERLTFRFVEVGFVVLSAALLLGLQTQERWHWDHKTVFSLLGWMTFALLIAGRHARGWRGRRATRWLYAGALLLLLAYIGSRFVLEVLLRRAA